jgi:hypothetical protein
MDARDTGIKKYFARHVGVFSQNTFELIDAPFQLDQRCKGSLVKVTPKFNCHAFNVAPTSDFAANDPPLRLGSAVEMAGLSQNGNGSGIDADPYCTNGNCTNSFGSSLTMRDQSLVFTALIARLLKYCR